MNRRDFLSLAPRAMAGYLASCTQKGERVNPERQSPTSPRGRGIAEITRSIRIVRDIPFAKRPGRELHLDVYAPKVDGKEPWPAILSFGIAAWRTQSKEIRPDLEHLPPSPTPTVYLPVMVPRGFVVVNAECRVAREARLPAQIQDCKCAVQWVRAHAQQFHIDPNRIGVAGGSSDGHLAALLAVTNSKDGLEDENCYPGYSSRVQAAFCFAGFFDFEYYQTAPGDGTPPGGRLSLQVTPPPAWRPSRPRRAAWPVAAPEATVSAPMPQPASRPPSRCTIASRSYGSPSRAGAHHPA